MAVPKIDPKVLTVGVFGYTGETGKALTIELLKQNLFKNVVLIGRRQVEMFKNAVKKKKNKNSFEQT